MKNTVNTDMKMGKKATIAKTQQIITDADRKFKEEHTFKPQINDYALPASKEQSKDERWKKLTEPKTADIQKRDRIKTQIEIEETQKTCPFKPQITSTKHAKSAKKENQAPLPERLMHEADKRKEKREKLKREMDLDVMKECSFKPTIIQSSHSGVNVNKFNSQAPIHERMSELQKEKNENLQRLRMKSEQEA